MNVTFYTDQSRTSNIVWKLKDSIVHTLFKFGWKENSTITVIIHVSLGTGIFFTSIEILNHGGVDKDSKEAVTCSKYWQVTSTARRSQLRPTNSLSAHFEYLFGNRPTRPANLLTNTHSIWVLVTHNLKMSVKWRPSNISSRREPWLFGFLLNSISFNCLTFLGMWRWRSG